MSLETTRSKLQRWPRNTPTLMQTHLPPGFSWIFTIQLDRMTMMTSMALLLVDWTLMRNLAKWGSHCLVLCASFQSWSGFSVMWDCWGDSKLLVFGENPSFSRVKLMNSYWNWLICFNMSFKWLNAYAQNLQTKHDQNKVYLRYFRITNWNPGNPGLNGRRLLQFPRQIPSDGRTFGDPAVALCHARISQAQWGQRMSSAQLHWSSSRSSWIKRDIYMCVYIIIQLD